MIPLRDYNPSRSVPVITVLLIAANVYVFFLELAAADPNAFVRYWALTPLCLSHELARPCASVLHPVLTTLVTSMFLHGGWLHIIGNMLYLWIFGDNIEDEIGAIPFAVFYLLCGLVAAYTQYLMAPESNVPIVGASGAIAGVLGAYIIRFPRTQVETAVFLGCWVTLVRLPAVIVLGVWALLQFYTGYGSLGVAHQAGGVAVFAHIGGFICGAVLTLIFDKGRP